MAIYDNLGSEQNKNFNNKQKVLFDGTKVSSGIINLSDSMNNYDYFKVFHSMGIITEVSDFTKLQTNYLVFIAGSAVGEVNTYRYTITKQSEQQLSISNPYLVGKSAASTTEGITKIVGCKL